MTAATSQAATTQAATTQAGESHVAGSQVGAAGRGAASAYERFVRDTARDVLGLDCNNDRVLDAMVAAATPPHNGLWRSMSVGRYTGDGTITVTTARWSQNSDGSFGRMYNTSTHELPVSWIDDTTPASGGFVTVTPRHGLAFAMTVDDHKAATQTFADPRH